VIFGRGCQPQAARPAIVKIKHRFIVTVRAASSPRLPARA
jgi:hypothetical protein